MGFAFPFFTFQIFSMAMVVRGLFPWKTRPGDTFPTFTFPWKTEWRGPGVDFLFFNFTFHI